MTDCDSDDKAILALISKIPHECLAMCDNVYASAAQSPYQGEVVWGESDRTMRPCGSCRALFLLIVAAMLSRHPRYANHTYSD